MRLTQRLLLSLLALVGLLVLAILTVMDLRLREGLLAESRRELEREARVVAALWTNDNDAPLVARAAGQALQHRVTLLLPNGVPLGDSELRVDQLGDARAMRELPEVATALTDSVGWSMGRVATGEELRVAVLAPQGIVRVTYDLSNMRAAFDDARRGLAWAGAVALLVAGAIAWLFARSVSRPVLELRDVARELAAGNLSRRPSLTAPGEIGDLANAIYRLVEQLSARMDALRSEEALHAAMSDALSEGVIAVDALPQVIRINATGRRLLGLNGATPFPVEHLPRDRALRDALAAALRGQATDAAEVVIGGHTLVLAARPLPDGGAVLALYDLTHIRKLEAVRRDFVANVSHELRTPLTVVRGFAETLVSDPVPEEERRVFSETIRANAERMQRIVDDLLDLSRIESGRWAPRPAVLEVRSVANETIASWAAEAGRKQVNLVVRVAPGAEHILADPTAVRQILGNLVGNSLRYTPAGGEVEIFAEQSAGGIMLGVKDTGSGIPAEHLPRIFERFYRVDPARSREAGGTGLGLAIVRHLVEAHGGRATATSAPGQGTTMTAFFPGVPGRQSQQPAGNAD